MYELAPDITREYILNKLSQEQIMERYLGCKIHLKKRFCSPLREDTNPSCGFFYNKEGDLLFNDFAGFFTGGCFKIVMHMHNCSFREALNLIAEDFGLLTGNPVPKEEHEKVVGGKSHTMIEVKRRSWDDRDRKYWTQFGISKATLELFHVSAVSIVWVNGKIVYGDKTSDPAYAYNFGGGNYKIYFPLRSANRFMCNCQVVQGSHIFRDYRKGVVLTKSLKDVMVFHELGITAVAPQSETVYPDSSYMEELMSLTPQIVTVYDFDRAGVTMANYIRKQYGIPALFFTNGRFGTENFGGKDISDVIKYQGRAWVNQVVSSAYANYCNGNNTSVHHSREDEQPETSNLLH